MASNNSRVARLIDQLAPKYHLDPAAVKADALGEGGLRFGAVGDHGTSFGPFQLHMGGALPSQYAHSARAAAAFANSPAGIEYAMRKMAEAGAAGLHGQAALASIVRDFERPAHVQEQIAKRSQFLGQFGGAAQGGAAPSIGGSVAPMFGGVDPKQALAGFLLQSAQQYAEGRMPGFDSLAQLGQMSRQLQSANEEYGSSATDTAFVQPAQMPRAVKTSGDLTWEGKPLSGESQDFVNRVVLGAKRAGATKIRVISAYRSPEHNADVGGAPRSNHTTGHAMDAEAFVPGRGWVPLGTLLKRNQVGLRSGDQPRFFKGRPDPNHVDDAFNMRG